MPKQTSNQPTKQKPVHEIRLGRIKATIWENETENGTRYNAKHVVAAFFQHGAVDVQGLAVKRRLVPRGQEKPQQHK